jgi:DNA (cytosine-5)-methyltransferase 1
LKSQYCKPAAQINIFEELLVDNFAGGGGTSTGIELATGRPVDIASNHDPFAILMHKTNHPYTKHFQEDVFKIDPVAVCHGQKVGLAWFSPDCKHFSRAKGSTPVSKKIRGLAWIVLRWAAKVRPRVIILENVPEFETWGPVRRGRPVKSKEGQTFKKWISQLNSLGYTIEYRRLRACDFGAPTSRERFFLIARCDGRPIVWPKPTHGRPDSARVKSGELRLWRTTAEIIDWSLPCPSVFDSSSEIAEKYNIKAVRPLADKTLRRVAKGIQKFVLQNQKPYIVECNHSGEGFRGQPLNAPLTTITGKLGCGLVMPFLTQYHSYKDQDVRGQAIASPLQTVDASNRYALVTASLVQLNRHCSGGSLDEPLHTITAGGGHHCLMTGFLEKYYGQGVGQILNAPLGTVVSKDRFGLVQIKIEKAVSGTSCGRWPLIRELLNRFCGYTLGPDDILVFTIDGEDYIITDIGLRMLTPRELYSAQGFPPDYIIDHDYLGHRYPKKEQVARCGNAVPPPFAFALVRANLPELCRGKCTTMEELNNQIAI